MNLPVCTNLTFGSDADGGSTATTASVSPNAKEPIFLSIASRTGISANPNTPTITGLGLTWTLVHSALFDSTSSSRRKGFVFMALAETTPTPGTIGIDFGGQAQTDVTWVVDQISRTKRDGVSGQGAIRQTGITIDEVGSTSVSASLAASPFPNNCTYGVICEDGIGGGTQTVGSGFTKIGEAHSASNVGLMTEFKTGVDTTVDASAGVSAFWGAMAFEINTATIKDIIGGCGPVAYNR